MSLVAGIHSKLDFHCSKLHERIVSSSSFKVSPSASFSCLSLNYQFFNDKYPVVCKFILLYLDSWLCKCNLIKFYHCFMLFSYTIWFFHIKYCFYILIVCFPILSIVLCTKCVSKCVVSIFSTYQVCINSIVSTGIVYTMSF